jgi:hypothetical protein
LQLAVHPKISAKRQDELMQSREANLKKARSWHGAARQVLLLGEKGEGSKVEKMIVKVDLLGILGKEWEVKKLEGEEVDEVEVRKIIDRAAGLWRELDELLGEGCEVGELIGRVDEQIADLKGLLGEV